MDRFKSIALVIILLVLVIFLLPISRLPVMALLPSNFKTSVSGCGNLAISESTYVLFAASLLSTGLPKPLIRLPLRFKFSK